MYITRQRLAKLGYTEDLKTLDCITAQALLYVDGCIEELKAEELKKKLPGKGVRP